VREDFPHTLTLEIGGSYANVTGGPHRENTVYISDIMARAGYSVANVGLQEAKFGVEFIRERQEQTGVEYISANLVRAGKHKPLLEPYVIREIGGLRIGILGLLDSLTPTPTELQEGDLDVLDPIETALKYVPRLRKKCGLVVVAGYVNINRARELAERVAGIDIILHRASRSRVNPERVGDTILAPAGKKSGHVAELELTLAATGAVENFVGEVVQLSETGPRDNEIHTAIDEILTRQMRERAARQKEQRDAATEAARAARERENAGQPPTTEATPGSESQPPGDLNRKAMASLGNGWVPSFSADASGFAGSSACQECHPDDFAKWEAGGHARAFSSLAETDDWGSSRCLPCHTSGYGSFGTSSEGLPAPEFWNVQCEACHGPGAAHVADQDVKLGPVRAAVCAACHTKEWSPEYEFTSWRARLTHGL